MELQEFKDIGDRECQEDALLRDFHFMARFMPFMALAFIAAFMAVFMAFMVLAFMTTFDGFLLFIARRRFIAFIGAAASAPAAFFIARFMAFMAAAFMALARIAFMALARIAFIAAAMVDDATACTVEGAGRKLSVAEKLKS